MADGSGGYRSIGTDQLCRDDDHGDQRFSSCRGEQDAGRSLRDLCAGIYSE